jgi:hypothetical protein
MVMMPKKWVSDHHVLVVADVGKHPSRVSARNGCRNA